MTRVLALVFVFAACAPTEDHFQVRGDASDEEVAAMQSGADAWCEATSGAWCATIDRGESRNAIEIVDPSALGTKQGWHIRHNGGARQWHEVLFADHRERETWLNDLCWLTVHELGHAYGSIDHIEGTVMQKHYDRTMWAACAAE